MQCQVFQYPALLANTIKRRKGKEEKSYNGPAGTRTLYTFWILLTLLTCNNMSSKWMKNNREYRGSEVETSSFLCDLSFFVVRRPKSSLNSQSSPGSGPGRPAAVGSLGAAAQALSTPLYPAGPSPLAAGPSRTSSSPPRHDPDAQQT